MKYKTKATKITDIERKWYVVDIADRILGRVATRIANALMGKDRVEYSDHVDCGDFVVVLNASKVKLTRGKALKKTYFSHSGFPGGAKIKPFNELVEKNPEFIIREAVKNMVPNNKLRDVLMKRLFVYSGAEHKHVAQKPVEIKL